MPTATLGAETIVQIWERGRLEQPVERALTVLSLLSGAPRDDVAAMSLERRDALLLAWRGLLFGDGLEGAATCPACGCEVEATVAVGELDIPEDTPVEIEVAGTRLAARMPTSDDLAAAAGAPSAGEARRILLSRCLGSSPFLEALTDEALAAVEAALDARAEVSAGAAALVCPDCGHAWELEVDVAAFTWQEIEILARRLLIEVDTLARRYGWTSGEILGLSAARRRFFLELAAQ
jgi:hypothetical protein